MWGTTRQWSCCQMSLQVLLLIAAKAYPTAVAAAASAFAYRQIKLGSVSIRNKTVPVSVDAKTGSEAWHEVAAGQG